MSSTISQCRSKIRKYNTLKNRIDKLYPYISSAAKAAFDVESTLNDKYLINDDASAVSNRTKQLKKEIESSYDYLQQVIIPAINTEIYYLNREIEILEEEERERAAAEEMKEEKDKP